jgi:3-oxoacyl-[acyl-carrier protein] reductase
MKKVLITGATKGIGLEISIQFAKKNYDLILISNNQLNLKKVKKKILSINKNIDCKIYKCDLSDEKKTIKLFANIKKTNIIDILINNFGGNYHRSKKYLNDYDNLNQLFKSNILCSYIAIKYFVGQMLRLRWGRIINISSSVNQGFSGDLNYNLVKSAQVNLIKNLSSNILYIKNNITFNVVSPGAILTETSKWHKILKKNPKLFKEIERKHFPMGFGKPSDVANIVIFLCNESSKYINGANIVVDGGRSNYKNFIN